MKISNAWRWVGLFAALLLPWGCAASKKPVGMPSEYDMPIQREVREPAPPPEPEKTPVAPKKRTAKLSERVITFDDLERVSLEHPDLSYTAAMQILAKLNARAWYYIYDDVRYGNPIKVPDDFGYYKTWTPLRTVIPEISGAPKFILLVKDIHYLGWYQSGRLVKDTYVCVGREDSWTKAGFFTVKQKDKDHISRSYTNAFGQPAPMPYALRIYGLVWIHMGDIERGNCSHGCINLPYQPAIDLFFWADVGTPVLIVESMKDIGPVVARHSSNCAYFPGSCTQHRDGEECCGEWSSRRLY